MSGRRGKAATMEQLGMILDGATEPPTRGTLHRATCHEIRHLINAGELDENAMAGTIQAARDLAALIDRASGLGGRKPDTYALAGLHRELREIRAELRGTSAASSDLSTLLDALAAADPVPASG